MLLQYHPALISSDRTCASVFLKICLCPVANRKFLKSYKISNLICNNDKTKNRLHVLWMRPVTFYRLTEWVIIIREKKKNGLPKTYNIVSYHRYHLLCTRIPPVTTGYHMVHVFLKGAPWRRRRRRRGKTHRSISSAL